MNRCAAMNRCAGRWTTWTDLRGVPEFDRIGHERRSDMEFLRILESREDVTTSLVRSILKGGNVLLIRSWSDALSSDDAPRTLCLKQSLYVNTPGSPVGLAEFWEGDL